jgi:hypothetical protein
MNTTYLRISLATLLCTVVFSVHAQISTYTFTQGVFSDQSQFFVPASAYQNPYYAYQKVLFPPGSFANPLKTIYTGDDTGSTNAYDTGDGYPIGFDFIYNGQHFDRVAVSGNGYIKLGKSGQPITIKNDTVTGTIYDGAAVHQNVLASFQTDATLLSPYASNLAINGGNESTVNLSMDGLPGNRTFVAQFTLYTQAGILLTHQIQLHERNNLVAFAYPGGGYNYPNTHFQGAIGIISNTDVSNLTVLNGVNTWPTAIRQSVPTSFCDFYTPVLPSGTGYSSKAFMYIWTPPTPAPSMPTCPLAYFSSENASDFPDGNTALFGGATTAYATEVFYVWATGARIGYNNPTLNWGDQSIATNQPTTYDVYVDTDNPPLVPIAQNLATTSYTLPILAPGTTYYYKIVPKNASGKDSVCTGSFTTTSMPQYCNVAETSGYIQSLSVNTLSFVATAANDIGKLPAIAPYITTLKRDTSYTCLVTLIGQISGGPWSRADVKAWIDFNQDGDFYDAGEAITGGSGGINGSFTFSIPVPNTARLGKTIMRIASKNVADYVTLGPCSSDFSGADENFVITIAPATPCQGFTINPAAINVPCFHESTGSINLNAAGGTMPYTINWTDGNTLAFRNDLPKGVYQASVTDAAGCEISTPLIPILQPAVLTADTATAANYITSILVSGGTTPYSYVWTADTGEAGSDANSAQLAPGTYSVDVTDANGCHISINNIRIKKSIATGLNVQQAENNAAITVYPNPTAGNLYLHAQLLQDIQLKILNEQGETVQQGTYTLDPNNPTGFDITSLGAGIYFLKIISDTSCQVVKIIRY